jgi:hypothetical protein
MATPGRFIVAGGGADCHLRVFCGDRFMNGLATLAASYSASDALTTIPA